MVNISIGRLKHGKTWRFGIRIHDNHCDNQAFLRCFTKKKTIINLINLLQDEMRWHRLREGAPGGGHLWHNGFYHHPFSWVSSISHLCFHLYLYHDICFSFVFVSWLCYWIISQKSWWPTSNITKWCEARDDFDYEWDDFDDWFCFRYLILILIFTWFWFCFRYFTYSMLLVLISCAVYQMMISALKVPWQWFQRWWFFFMNMTIICNHFSGRLPHAPIHGLPLHRPLQVCLFSPILSKSDILFTNTIIIMI